MTRRLSIGYLVPGHYLLSSAGPSRNVLSLARALSEKADVTVAFRRSLETPDEPFRVVELQPGEAPRGAVDDAAVRGTGVADLWRYLGDLRRFVRAHDFDVVLEKSWLFSGTLGVLYKKRGIPAAVVENVVRVWKGARMPPSRWAGLAKHALSQSIVGRRMREVDLVIAETDQLKAALIERWGLDDSAVRVVGLGVDHERFRPSDRGEARRALGWNADATIVLYTGVLDPTHDVSPVLEALRELHPPAGRSFELHLVGEGDQRARYEEAALGARCRVAFHGRVAHDEVPRCIAAADLCIAPYDVAAFPGGLVAYSTLKIPEYMACARPVATVPSGRPGALVRDGETGFLLSNTPQAWRDLLERLPERAELDAMGAAARESVASIRWSRTADEYLALCEGLAGRAPRAAEALGGP